MDIEKEKIRRKIRSIKSLPTLPAVAQKVSKLAESDTTSASQLSTIISQDQALSGRVLRLVNSSFYGFPGRISNISNAILLLGFDVVKSLIISVSVFEMMEKGIIGLWEHSLGCAVAARIIARRVKECDPEELSVAGLLHDIGKVVVSVQMNDSYEDIKRVISEQKVIFYEAEKQVLEFTHEDIGSWLAESWNLPVNLLEPISYHHQPVKAPKAKLPTAIVHVADFLTRAVGFGSGGDPWAPPLNHKAFERIGLTLQTMEDIVREFNDELETLEARSMFEGTG
ncbi:MAG: HDOD domain-containing protein [Desulfobacterota bacterium]|nr:HDOD domain-containing protein [Thermodesulfobacteriota bacterium]